MYARLQKSFHAQNLMTCFPRQKYSVTDMQHFPTSNDFAKLDIFMSSLNDLLVSSCWTVLKGRALDVRTCCLEYS